MARLVLRMNKNDGFTILEAIITLTIVCSIAILGSMQMKQIRERIVFTQSVNQFKMSLEQACRIAAISHEMVEVNYYASDHELETKGKGYYRKVNFDPSIKLFTIYHYRISDQGMISPRKIAFSNGQYKKTLKVQMAWGRMKIEE